MENIIISNPKKLEKKKREIFKAGTNKLHVVSDFDKTLTKAFVNNRAIPSVISVLRDNNYLSREYSYEAKELFKKYHPIEIDPKIQENEKKKKMQEWWTKHFELLIKSKLNKKDLERIVREDIIKFREGALEFLDRLHEYDIPLVILSSSGVGDTIKMLLEKNKRLYDNIYIVTNEYIWDENGNAVAVKEPIIHSMNKSEISIKEMPFYPKIKDRVNVLLLGDGLGDLGMVKGFDYKNLIGVGFLNEKIEENLKDYKQNFDVVITNYGDFNWVNDFVRLNG